MTLTRRQRQVLDVIRRLIDDRGYSPSLEEIGSQLGLSSVATVHKHVSHLVDKGFVRRNWNQNRSIELTEIDLAGAIRLPLRGAIAAGAPVEAIAEQESISVPASLVPRNGSVFALRVRGDSMVDEQIRDGDLIIVEERQTAENGETVVALVDGVEATLKRFESRGPQVVLSPANSAMSPIELHHDRVRIQGVVVAVLRRF